MNTDEITAWKFSALSFFTAADASAKRYESVVTMLNVPSSSVTLIPVSAGFDSSFDAAFETFLIMLVKVSNGTLIF